MKAVGYRANRQAKAATGTQAACSGKVSGLTESAKVIGKKNEKIFDLLIFRKL